MDLEYMIWRMRKDFLGKALYAFNAEPYQAPGIVSCQTLVSVAYGYVGVAIPWLISEQIQCGFSISSVQEGRIGDLVFRTGRQGNWNGVGHVGVFTESRTVIHAFWKAKTVVEEPVDSFLLRPDSFRGMRRILKG